MFCSQKSDHVFRNYNTMEKVREKVITQINAGDRAVDIAKAFGIARSTVYGMKKRYKATGSYSVAPGRGRMRSAHTKTIQAVKNKIKHNPLRSINQLAKDHNILLKSMARLCKDDLNLKSRAVIKCQTLTAKNRAARLERCKKMLNILKSKPQKVIVFSNEKNQNSRNSRYIAHKPEDIDPSVRYVSTAKFPAKAMSHRTALLSCRSGSLGS